MAIDKSVIVIPSVSGVTVAPKLETSVPFEDFVFNNGLYIQRGTLNKTLPKSLMRVLKKGNKIYIFDRNTSKLDYVFNQIFNGSVSIINDNKKVFIKTNSSGISWVSKNRESGIVELYERFNSTAFPKETYNNTTYTKTDDSIINLTQNVANKKLNLYSIRTNEIDRLSEYNTNTTELNLFNKFNFLLRVKSLMATEDNMNYSYLERYKYYLSNLFLPLLDTSESNFTNDTFIQKFSKLKNIVAPILEPNLIKVKDFNILSSRVYEGTVIELENQNIKLLEIAQDTPESGKYFALIKNDERTPLSQRLIVNQQNYQSFVGKIVVLSNGISLIPIKIKNDFIDYTYLEPKGGFKTGKAFSFEFIKHFDKKYKLSDLVRRKKFKTTDVLEIVPSSDGVYSITILNEEDYPGFVVFGDNTRLLELTIDESTNQIARNINSFKTNTQGDYYVIEIE